MEGPTFKGPTLLGHFSANQMRSFGEVGRPLKQSEALFFHLWKLGVNVTALKMYEITSIKDLRAIVKYVTKISVQLFDEVIGKIQELKDHELAKLVSSTKKITLPVSEKVLFARVSGTIDSRPLFRMFFLGERTEKIPICEFYLTENKIFM